ncbi:MAG: flagellar filament capping protein FliD [Oscillospiraceae bacterium]|nr:flagellar filament capping protein FliD [Oscillospiraceae bacterium]
MVNNNRLRISGLNSGLDVEAIVKAMSGATQLRINSNKRKVLQLQAQQDAYRSVINKFQTFKNTYFDQLNRANYLKNSSIFNQTKTSVFNAAGDLKTPAGVSVSSGTGAKSATYNVELVNNASQAKLEGVTFGAGVAIDVNALDSAEAGDTFAFLVRVGTVSKTFAFNVTEDGKGLDALNLALKKEFGTANDGEGIVRVDSSGNITSTNRSAISVSDIIKMEPEKTLSFDPRAMETGANSLYIQIGEDVKQIVFRTASSKDFTIDGQSLIPRGINDSAVQAHISDIATQRLADALAENPNLPENRRYDWIRESVEAEYESKLNLFNSTTEKMHDDLVWEEYQSVKDDLTAAQKDELFQLAFNNVLDRQQLPHFETLFKENNGGFTDAREMMATHRSGSLDPALSARFAEITKNVTFVKEDSYKNATYSEYTAYREFGVNILDGNGDPINTSGTLQAFRDDVTVDEILTYGNEYAFKTAVESHSWNDDEKITVEFDNGKAILKTTDGSAFTVSTATSPLNDLDLPVLEVKAVSVDVRTTLASLGIGAETGKITINGVEIDVNPNMSVNGLMDAVNNSSAGVKMSYSSLTNSFTMTASAHGRDGKIDIVDTDDGLFAKLGLDVNSGATFTNGKNLTLRINDQLIETAGNSYTIDGTTFSFEPHAVEGEKFRVEVGPDRTVAAEAIKNFVTDYNKLIDEIYGMLNEKPNKNYHFLTEYDIEEMGMSDRQVEQWQDLSKRGILNNNSTINDIMSRVRMSMLTSVTDGDGKAFSIFNIKGKDGASAIVPTSGREAWRDNGKLVIDEQALLEALETNPDEIMKLFTDPVNGIMAKLEAEIDRAVSTSLDESGNPKGVLIRMAGLPTGTSSTKNTLFDRIKDLNDRIDTLQARYERQQDRYWKMFTAMEKQFSLLNSQSSYIMNMFPSNN